MNGGSKPCFQRWLACCLTILVVGFGSKLPAALLAYEGFEYDVGNALNGSGAPNAQWTAAWDNLGVVGGTTTIQAGSLTYTDAAGDTLPTTGQSILNSGIDGTNSQQGRNLVARRGTDDTSTWISFLGQRTGAKSPTFVRGANFTLIDTTAANAERLNIGENSNLAQDTWMVRQPPGSANDKFSTVPFETLSLFVARIDHKLGNDDYFFWINPLLKTVPLDSSAAGSSIGLTDLSFDRVRTFAGNPAGGNPHAEWLMDEVRIGESYSDVVGVAAVPILAGDTDTDGIPGEFPDDFAPIQANFRKTVTLRTQGDLVSNGFVDFADFRQWKTAFLAGGRSLAGLDLGLFNNIPEPATFVSICTVAIVLFATRRQRPPQ
jgi:hypothetical protein